MHHIGRSVGLDCDCSDIHTCEMLVFGAGKTTWFKNGHYALRQIRENIHVQCIKIISPLRVQYHCPCLKKVQQNRFPLNSNCKLLSAKSYLII